MNRRQFVTSLAGLVTFGALVKAEPKPEPPLTEKSFTEFLEMGFRHQQEQKYMFFQPGHWSGPPYREAEIKVKILT